ncbi:MAG: hypothetical protein RDV41_09000 [Planctomycetota bacterium]|nr:hypothetical protein [Planctomycetota bacterium]
MFGPSDIDQKVGTLELELVTIQRDIAHAELDQLRTGRDHAGQLSELRERQSEVESDIAELHGLKAKMDELVEADKRRAEDEKSRQEANRKVKEEMNRKWGEINQRERRRPSP